MTTKKLARTILEGGRASPNKFDRRHSHSKERACARNFLKEVIADPDVFEESDPDPIERVYKGFGYNLGAIYRWLNHQTGRHWDDIYSELKSKFDVRTTAGRHIIYDNIIKY